MTTGTIQRLGDCASGAKPGGRSGSRAKIDASRFRESVSGRGPLRVRLRRVLVDELVLPNNDVAFLRRVNASGGEVLRAPGLLEPDPMRAEGLADRGLFQRRQRRYTLTCLGRRIAMEVRPSRMQDLVRLWGDRLGGIRRQAAEDAQPFREVFLPSSVLRVLTILRRSPYLPFLTLDAADFDALLWLEGVGLVENVEGMLWLSPQGMLVLAQARWVFAGSSATVRVLLSGP